MHDLGLLHGRCPAIVREYMPDTRQCRVEIPGITDGGDVLPLAEIEYPIGDKAKAGVLSTEIEILPGDTVWVAFIGGDPRYPIITGWRCQNAGNSSGLRRLHHANMELLADALMRFIAGQTLTIHAQSIELVSDSLTHNGVNIGSDHVHGGISPGSADTDQPH